MIEIVVPAWDKYRPGRTLAAIAQVRQELLKHRGTTRVRMIREAAAEPPIVAAKIEA